MKVSFSKINVMKVKVRFEFLVEAFVFGEAKRVVLQTILGFGRVLSSR